MKLSTINYTSPNLIKQVEKHKSFDFLFHLGNLLSYLNNLIMRLQQQISADTKNRKLLINIVLNNTILILQFKRTNMLIILFDA